jgi:hypothetical protein
MSSKVRTQWRRGFLDDVLNSPQVQADLEVRGRRVLAAAQSAAPGDSGAYRDSLRGVTDRSDRTRVRVETTDPAGRIIEKRHGVLEHALDAARG